MNGDTREDLEEIALEHANGVGQDMDEVREDLVEMTTDQIRRTLRRLGYTV